MSATCAVHRDEPGVFECDSCGAVLCHDCVTEGKYLTTCGLCGELALPVQEVPATAGGPRPGSPGSAPGSTAATPAERTFPILLTNHVIVPGSIIALVTALLFFLVDVRSVFLPMGMTLKWLGFWFVIATVLIARYGRMSADKDRQGCYTIALVSAMAVVLVVEPWEKGPGNPLGILVNAVIVFAVWRYATRLTARLSREGEEVSPVGKRLRLYGVERLELEAWEKAQDDARIQARRSLRKSAEARKKTADAHGNPSAAVARLVALGLVAFAVGEPFLLSGPPAVGERALAAVVVFLLSAGLVLAAGSAVGTLRHARRLGGSVSEELVPSRVFGAGLLMLVLLAVALAVPGVAYRGSGEIAPPRAAGIDSDLATDAGADPETGEADDEADEQPTDAGRSSDRGQRAQGRSAEGGAEVSGAEEQIAMATSMLDFLTTVGKYLALPFLLAVILGILYVLARLAPLLATMRLRGWRGWLARLAAVFRRRKKKGPKKSGPRLKTDLDLGELEALGPREAVVTGYARLLLALEAVGYPRDVATPYEFLEGLPAHFKGLREPLESLTALYVRAAYSTADLSHRDRGDAISALARIKRQLPASGSD